MNSIVFIREARALIVRMDSLANVRDREMYDQQTKVVQQDLDYMCNNMTNPSLPSALRLIQAAQKHRYSVDSKVIHKVNQFA
jgi:hypothetical protein